MKVLYVNHTAHVGGGERSLLTLLPALPAHISAGVACPEGPLADAVGRLHLPVTAIPSVEGSLRLHPLHNTHALLQLSRAVVSLRVQSRRLRPDLVHANSIRAGVIAALSARLGGPPAIVHVRDCLPRGRVSSATLALIAANAAGIVVNSRHTAACVPAHLRPRSLRVVPNAVDLERFDPARFDRRAERARLGLDSSTTVLAIVAQLTPWKGQDLAVRVTAALKERGLSVRLLLVGSAKFVSPGTRLDNRTYVAELHRLIGALGVAHEVIFLGEREDVPEILAATDLVLVPSWEEPFGRAVIEALAMEVPVAATSVGGPREILQPGVDGVLLPPRRPEAWAAAIVELLGDLPRLRAMGANGRRSAAHRFGVTQHVEAITGVYAEALAGRS